MHPVSLFYFPTNKCANDETNKQEHSLKIEFLVIIFFLNVWMLLLNYYYYCNGGQFNLLVWKNEFDNRICSVLRSVWIESEFSCFISPEIYSKTPKYIDLIHTRNVRLVVCLFFWIENTLNEPYLFEKLKIKSKER